METEICTRILPARGRGPDRRFAFPRVETRCMALGWGRMPDARSVVCALRQRIVVWQWLVLIGLAGAANAAGSNMPWAAPLDRKSVVLGRRVSVRVDLGGRRSIKKKTKTNTQPP